MSIQSPFGLEFVTPITGIGFASTIPCPKSLGQATATTTTGLFALICRLASVPPVAIAISTPVLSATSRREPIGHLPHLTQLYGLCVMTIFIVWNYWSVFKESLIISKIFAILLSQLAFGLALDHIRFL